MVYTSGSQPFCLHSPLLNHRGLSFPPPHTTQAQGRRILPVKLEMTERNNRQVLSQIGSRMTLSWKMRAGARAMGVSRFGMGGSQGTYGSFVILLLMPNCHFLKERTA